MNAAEFRDVLVSPDSVCWVKDREQIIILDEHRRAMFVLRDIEVAVWGWLMLKHPYAKIVRLLTVMLGGSADEAELYLWTILQKWISAGILQIESG